MVLGTKFHNASVRAPSVSHYKIIKQCCLRQPHKLFDSGILANRKPLIQGFRGPILLRSLALQTSREPRRGSCADTGCNTAAASPSFTAFDVVLQGFTFVHGKFTWFCMASSGSLNGITMGFPSAAPLF